MNIKPQQMEMFVASQIAERLGELNFLISRTALVRDPYAGWCGRAPQ